MRTRYNADAKSGPVVTVGPVAGGRNVVFGGDKAVRGKRPCSKKTAAELLYKDDEHCRGPQLTAIQRETLVKRAGDQYKKRDPFAKRPTESVQDYVARVNKLVANPMTVTKLDVVAQGREVKQAAEMYCTKCGTVLMDLPAGSTAWDDVGKVCDCSWKCCEHSHGGPGTHTPHLATRDK